MVKVLQVSSSVTQKQVFWHRAKPGSISATFLAQDVLKEKKNEYSYLLL